MMMDAMTGCRFREGVDVFLGGCGRELRGLVCLEVRWDGMR